MAGDNYMVAGALSRMIRMGGKKENLNKWRCRRSREITRRENAPHSLFFRAKNAREKLLASEENVRKIKYHEKRDYAVTSKHEEYRKLN